MEMKVAQNQQNLSGCNVFNFLTFDVEEWFEAEIPQKKLRSIPDQNTDIEKKIDLFIEICNRLDIKSTCFVIGELAYNKPHLVKKLHINGHEIASHSYSHKMICTMTPAEFRSDLHKSVKILENLTGIKVKGFRAPAWSIDASTATWFYKVLEEESLIYSSSIYPAKTFLYGMPEATPIIHRVDGSSVIELPQQIINLGILKTGFAGGTYLRIFPAWFIKKMIQLKNKRGNSVFMYVHPWELIYKRYPVKLSALESIIQYWGIRKNADKILNVCKPFRNSFIRMDDFVENRCGDESDY